MVSFGFVSLRYATLLVFGFFHRRSRRTLCHVSCCRRRGFRACGLRCGGCGDRLGLLLLLLLWLVGDFLDVAVLVLVFEWGEALLALGGLAFAVRFGGKLGGFSFFFGEFLVFDVVGCLVWVSLFLFFSGSASRVDVPLAMPIRV